MGQERGEPILTHDVCVALGLAVAGYVFVREVRHRRANSAVDDRIWSVVAGALVGGAVLGRLGTWAQHLDPRDNATLAQQWLYGNRSILSGLLGAYLGALAAALARATEGSAGMDHQCAPFCAVQAWPALAGQRLPATSSMHMIQ